MMMVVMTTILPATTQCCMWFTMSVNGTGPRTRCAACSPSSTAPRFSPHTRAPPPPPPLLVSIASFWLAPASWLLSCRTCFVGVGGV